MATAARIALTPGTALIDAPVSIRVTGLPPERGIILRAATVDRYGNRWSSRLGYRADRSGVVDTHSNMRLFWSMQPTRRLPLAEQSFSAPEALTPVELTALIGGRRVASARLLRSRRTSDLMLTKTTLPNEGFIGTFAARPSHASPPAVLIIAGSLPGHDPSLAEQLASNGFPALAIGYWGEPGLPPSLQNIPLEYFSTALHWLAKQPGVDPRRIVVLGISRGGEAALLLGVSFPELVQAVEPLLRQLDFHGEELKLVDATVALSIVAAVGDFGRFSSPQRPVCYLGLNPLAQKIGRPRAACEDAGIGVERDDDGDGRPMCVVSS